MTQLKQTAVEQNKKENVDNVNVGVKKLTDLINEYKILSLKLHEFAKAVPADGDEQISFAKDHDALLDQQQDVLTSAQNLAINGVKDLQSLLELWYLDEIRDVGSDDISAGQHLAYRVYDYLTQNKQQYENM